MPRVPSPATAEGICALRGFSRPRGGDELCVMYRAATALPWDDREQATVGLRGQLRVMATAGRAIPDWSTLVIDGPTEVCEPHGLTWFEWTGRVRVAGEDLPDLPPDDADLLPRRAEETMPAPAATLLATPARCPV